MGINLVALVVTAGMAYMVVSFVDSFWKSALLYMMLAVAGKMLIGLLSHGTVMLPGLTFDTGFQAVLALFYFFVLSGTKDVPLLFFPCLLIGAWVMSLTF